jgi:hypothetical protein
MLKIKTPSMIKTSVSCPLSNILYSFAWNIKEKDKIDKNTKEVLPF